MCRKKGFSRASVHRSQALADAAAAFRAVRPLLLRLMTSGEPPGVVDISGDEPKERGRHEVHPSASNSPASRRAMGSLASATSATATAQAAATVMCPLCRTMVDEGTAQQHVNQCLDGGPRGAAGAARAAAAPRGQRQPQGLISAGIAVKPQEKIRRVVYTKNLLPTAKLKKMLRGHGLPSDGPREELVARHREFVTQWNANCDTRPQEQLSKPAVVSKVMKHLESLRAQAELARASVAASPVARQGSGSSAASPVASGPDKRPPPLVTKSMMKEYRRLQKIVARKLGKRWPMRRNYKHGKLRLPKGTGGLETRDDPQSEGTPSSVRQGGTEWRCVMSARLKKPFYFNESTGIGQWEAPAGFQYSISSPPPPPSATAQSTASAESNRTRHTRDSDGGVTTVHDNTQSPRSRSESVGGVAGHRRATQEPSHGGRPPLQDSDKSTQRGDSAGPTVLSEASPVAGMITSPVAQEVDNRGAAPPAGERSAVAGWSCRLCTFANDATATECDMCGCTTPLRTRGGQAARTVSAGQTRGRRSHERAADSPATATATASSAATVRRRGSSVEVDDGDPGAPNPKRRRPSQSHNPHPAPSDGAPRRSTRQRKPAVLE